MRRYVRRGSTGIALIDNSGGKPFLRYVFDVADTGGEDETRPQLWKYREEHRETVSAALERRFDVPIGDGSLPEQLEKISVQFMADYWRVQRPLEGRGRKDRRQHPAHTKDCGF